MKDTPMSQATIAESDRLLRTADLLLEVHRTVKGDDVRNALFNFRYRTKRNRGYPTAHCYVSCAMPSPDTPWIDALRKYKMWSGSF